MFRVLRKENEKLFDEIQSNKKSISDMKAQISLIAQETKLCRDELIKLKISLDL